MIQIPRIMPFLTAYFFLEGSFVTAANRGIYCNLMSQTETYNTELRFSVQCCISSTTNELENVNCFPVHYMSFA
jgi:hypothetical protein